MSTRAPRKSTSPLLIALFGGIGFGLAAVAMVALLVVWDMADSLPGFTDPVPCSEVLVAGKVIPPDVLRAGCSLPNRGTRQFTATPCGTPGRFLYTMDQWFTDDVSKPLKDGRANPSQFQIYTSLCSVG